MEHSFKRVTKRVFGIRDFPYLKLGIRDLKAKSGRDSGLKVCARGGMPKITLGITGLHEILGRDYGMEEPYWGPSFNPHNFDNHQLFFKKRGQIMISMCVLSETFRFEGEYDYE